MFLKNVVKILKNQSALKSGSCPRLANQIGICEQECSSDADCSADLKCCSNGCGSVCVKPDLVAPPPPPTAQQYQGTPPRITSTTDEVSVEEGSLATLECACRGDPRPNVHWTFQGERVSTIVFWRKNFCVPTFALTNCSR
jgi:hypothetical protein